MKVNFTDKTQTDKNWEVADHTDKTINFWIEKLLIKKKNQWQFQIDWWGEVKL